MQHQRQRWFSVAESGGTLSQARALLPLLSPMLPLDLPPNATTRALAPAEAAEAAQAFLARLLLARLQAQPASVLVDLT